MALRRDAALLAHLGDLVRGAPTEGSGEVRHPGEQCEAERPKGGV
jgi:hypothetical protein